MIRPLLIVFLLAFCFNRVSAQQEVQFSEYVFNPLLLNPAYTGNQESTQINLMYRDQWSGLSDPPRTFSASIDGVSKDLRSGFGAYFINDRLGPQVNTSGFINYAYRVKLSEGSRLNFGISAGMLQYSIDGTRLFTVQPEPGYTGAVSTAYHPEMNVGLVYVSSKYYAGLSVNDLLSNVRNGGDQFLSLHRERHFYAEGGALFRISDNFAWKPSLLVKEDFHGPTNIDFNTLFIIEKKLLAGASYRTGLIVFKHNLQNSLGQEDALSIMAGYEFEQHWRLGYAFDLTVNSLQSVSHGTHEFSLRYRFLPRYTPQITPRYYN